jgi:hypothetical protein
VARRLILQSTIYFGFFYVVANVAIVTGGSGALGLAVAGAIVESGGDVILLDTQEAHVEFRGMC